MGTCDCLGVSVEVGCPYGLLFVLHKPMRHQVHDRSHTQHVQKFTPRAWFSCMFISSNLKTKMHLHYIAHKTRKTVKGQVKWG